MAISNYEGDGPSRVPDSVAPCLGHRVPSIGGQPWGALGKALPHEPAKGGISAPDVLDS